MNSIHFCTGTGRGGGVKAVPQQYNGKHVLKHNRFCTVYLKLHTVHESFSETLRVQYGEDGVGRRKSGPIASRATSGRLA